MARAGVAVLPWRPHWPELRLRSWIARYVPTRRSLVVGFGIAALALCAYVLARESSLFAIDRIEVQGGSPRVDGQVQQALESIVGKPLVGLDGSGVVERVEALPTVVSATYDRDFPHTLRVTIVPERPAAVLRSGVKSWLVSIRGRVMERLPESSADANLPRVWIAGSTAVHVGAVLAVGQARAAVRAAGLAGPLAPRITTASYSCAELVFHLHSGLQVLLGTADDVKLKVAVAVHALPLLPSGSTFLDVSVPGRAVSGIGSPFAGAPQGSSRG